ncbi:MAG: hypothetical protein ACJA1N_001368 [Saprospiraceae bacterium]|jgi:hypothetical protein|tara:strand:- start:360 stop:1148 length:789 start_codon:yes stop_codon:yes gene_type:complete
MKEKPFYIGWQNEMSPQHKSLLKRFLIPLFILIPVLIIGVVLSQRPFNNHQFELGNVKEFTGIYHAKPYPILEITEGDLPKDFSKFALLVGYGKFGAEGTMETIEAQNGQSFDHKKITLKGSLIYGDGKIVIELTEQDNSLVEVHDERQPPSKAIFTEEEGVLVGEILDPKCYFGVMKPAVGTIHKSCAIRCISGGIPPVFRVQVNRSGDYDYYLVIDENGQEINKSILPLIGKTLDLNGKLRTENGWKVLYVNSDNFRKYL